MNVLIKKTTAIFFLLCMVFIPLNFSDIGFQYQITQFLFHDFVQFLQNNLFANALQNIDFSSDTIAFNLLIFCNFIIAIFCAAICQIFKISTLKLVSIARTVVVFYLAFVLLKYGFDKIFKNQFYIPEPNILYSQLGNLSRDTLYWSTMGTSRFYSISLGLIEVFTATFLLISRTRIFGLLLSMGVFINILIINFGFDISVKTFSGLLLLMTIFAVYPAVQSIYNFFICKQTTQLNCSLFYIFKNQPTNVAVHFFIIGLMLITVLQPYFLQSNFNDDSQRRPFLHGCYQVVSANQKVSKMAVQYIFIHRKNYLIIQNYNGQQLDYQFTINTKTNQIKLTDSLLQSQTVYYQYRQQDSTLQLNFKNLKLFAKAQNWRALRVLKNDFHFTIDSMD